MIITLDNKLMVTGSKKGCELRLWRLQDGECLKIKKLENLEAVSISRD
jgi:hypothetical protein